MLAPEGSLEPFMASSKSSQAGKVCSKTFEEEDTARIRATSLFEQLICLKLYFFVFGSLRKLQKKALCNEFFHQSLYKFLSYKS